MKKIISALFGALLVFSLNTSVANAAAKEVRVAYFLEWPSPNLEDMNTFAPQKPSSYWKWIKKALISFKNN